MHPSFVPAYQPAPFPGAFPAEMGQAPHGAMPPMFPAPYGMPPQMQQQMPQQMPEGQYPTPGMYAPAPGSFQLPIIPSQGAYQLQPGVLPPQPGMYPMPPMPMPMPGYAPGPYEPGMPQPMPNGAQPQGQFPQQEYPAPGEYQQAYPANHGEFNAPSGDYTPQAQQAPQAPQPLQAPPVSQGEYPQEEFRQGTPPPSGYQTPTGDYQLPSCATQPPLMPYHHPHATHIPSGPGTPVSGQSTVESADAPTYGESQATTAPYSEERSEPPMGTPAALGSHQTVIYGREDHYQMPVPRGVLGPAAPDGSAPAEVHETRPAFGDARRGGNMRGNTRGGEYTDPKLPFWTDEGEQGEHISVMLRYKVMKCPEGPMCTRKHSCWGHHTMQDHRRAPVDFKARVRYWPVMCPRHPKCPAKEHCCYAHSDFEILYHPCLFKSALNNGKRSRMDPLTQEKPAPYCHMATDENDLRPVKLTLRYAPPRYVPTFTESEDAESRPSATSWSVRKCQLHGRRGKEQFCMRYPEHVRDGKCDKPQCANAHSRDELKCKLFTEREERWEFDDVKEWNHFLMYKYKTLACPYAAGHDWTVCPYAHHDREVRRSPLHYSYCSDPCPYWGNNEQCPDGDWCRYAHGPKEELYHEEMFKTKECRFPEACQRLVVCAFHHSQDDRRPRRRPGRMNHGNNHHHHHHHRRN